MAKKMFYSMGEVAEMFDVRPSLLRHWEAKFDILRPHKNKKGNRMFTPEDVDNLKIIYHLVKERGMTLAGAAQYLKQGVSDSMRRDMELLERLQHIRAELAEVRERLKDAPEGLTVLEVAEPIEESSAESEIEAQEKPRQEETQEDPRPEMPAAEAQPASEMFAPEVEIESEAASDAESAADAEAEADPTPRPRGAKSGRNRRKQEAKLFEVDPEPQRPIAPFFDQTLF